MHTRSAVEGKALALHKAIEAKREGEAVRHKAARTILADPHSSNPRDSPTKFITGTDSVLPVAHRAPPSAAMGMNLTE